MSRNGGYKIIDFKGVPFTSGTEKTINGIYDAIESTNKVTLVSGLVIGSTEYDDMFVPFNVNGTDFEGLITFADGSTVEIDVADNDGVTVTYTEGE